MAVSPVTPTLSSVNPATEEVLASFDPLPPESIVRTIESGALFVSAIVASDPRLPFGGIKQSGYGSELGEHGIREFTNVRTTWNAAS